MAHLKRVAMIRNRTLLSVFVAALTACGAPAKPVSAPVNAVERTKDGGAATAPHESLKRDAAALRGVVTSPLAGQMLDAVASLPVLPGRTVFLNWDALRVIEEPAFEQLTAQAQKGFEKAELASEDYYQTLYGSPLVYTRLLDILAKHAPHIVTLQGQRIVELGFGQLGQGMLWTQMGAEVVALDTDGFIHNLIGNVVDNLRARKVKVPVLLNCHWPQNAECRQTVGQRYSLLVARNLLKKGYVKPAKLDPRYPEPVGWGLSDAAVLSHIHDALVPGGIVLIYSIGNARDPEKPMTMIENPWPANAWEAAGFDVLAHDVDESEIACNFGQALGWGQRAELAKDLFGVYSVYRRKS